MCCPQNRDSNVPILLLQSLLVQSGYKDCALNRNMYLKVLKACIFVLQIFTYVGQLFDTAGVDACTVLRALVADISISSPLLVGGMIGEIAEGP